MRFATDSDVSVFLWGRVYAWHGIQKRTITFIKRSTKKRYIKPNEQVAAKDLSARYTQLAVFGREEGGEKEGTLGGGRQMSVLAPGPRFC